MRISLRFSLGLVAIAALGCQSNTPISPAEFGMAGAAGHTGAAGSGAAGHTGAAGSGVAGMAMTGAAGMATSGAAGAAGTPTAGAAGGLAGAAGTGTGGAAGALITGVGGSGAGGGVVAICGSPTRADGTCVAGAYHRPTATGACRCQEITPCVCGDSCVDPLTDDDNCGACGHRCGPTSTCIQGVCGPPVVNVLPAQSGCGSMDLAISGDTLYWTERDHYMVRSMPLAGGAITTISAGEKYPEHIATVGKHVFWTSFGYSIRHAVDRMIVSNVVNWPTPIGGFVVSPDASTAYFSAGTDVWRVPTLGGGAAVAMAHEENFGIPRGLTLSGNKLAFTTDNNADVDLVTLVDGQVASCGKEDANGNLLNFNCTRLARSQGQLLYDVILSTPTRVFFADGSNVKSEDTVKPIGVFDFVATTDQDAISGLAMSGMLVYFAQAGSIDSDGVIYKAPNVPNLTNAPGIRIARGQSNPRSLAVGAKKVYWSTAKCTIESQDL